MTAFFGSAGSTSPKRLAGDLLVLADAGPRVAAEGRRLLRGDLDFCDARIDVGREHQYPDHAQNRDAEVPNCQHDDVPLRVEMDDAWDQQQATPPRKVGGNGVYRRSAGLSV